MALPLTNNDPPTTAGAALPTLDDWLTLWAPLRLAPRFRLALARRALQRRAARQVSRGECSVIASLIVAGNWAKLDKIMDVLEGEREV